MDGGFAVGCVRVAWVRMRADSIVGVSGGVMAVSLWRSWVCLKGSFYGIEWMGWGDRIGFRDLVG